MAETDPEVARLKSSAALVRAIEAAVRFYEEPPTKRPRSSTTDWRRSRLTADDWAEAFEAAEPGTPHNEARDLVWEELLTILLVEKHDGDDRRAAAAPVAAAQPRSWSPTLQPGLAAARGGRPGRRPVVGAGLPAQVRALAERRRGPRLAAPGRAGLDGRPTCRCWTRPGSGSATRRRRGAGAGSEAAVAAEREQMDRVVDDLIAAGRRRSAMGLMSMLRGEDLQDALVDEAALPAADPDLLAGPFAHVVVDEAQELTDAEWQMLLLRCPSRSFTIVGDRAQARHGFTESWQERLERVGLDRIDLASLSINYRTPEEVMAEAEPVIRAVLPDANVPTSIRSSGLPVVHGAAADLRRDPRRAGSATHAEGIACVIGDPTFPDGAPGAVADPGAGQGTGVRPGRPGRPGRVRRRASRARSTATSR